MKELNFDLYFYGASDGDLFLGFVEVVEVHKPQQAGV
jgi:hypothetical protein